MKKLIKILPLVFILVITLCSCGNKPAVKIGNDEVQQDVFAYFLDYVYINEGKSKKYTDKQLKEKATELSAQYLKINKKFKEKKLSLPANVKANISTEVDNQWAVFGPYYSSIGVKKTTLTKIYENKAYKDELLISIYGEKGSDPVSEETIKTYFTDNYVFFKSINGYLKDDAKSDEEKQAVIEKFSNMAGQINGGESIEVVNNNYLTSLKQDTIDNMDVSVINKSTKNYPKGFYDKVHDIETNKADSIVLDDYIFVVQKYDNFDSDLKFYDKYKSKCLTNIVKDDYNKKINSWYDSKKIIMTNSAQKNVLKQFKEARKIA